MTPAERVLATEAVLARFRDKPLDWKKTHCIKLARAQGKAMGHKLPPMPQIRGPISAKRALAARGVESVTELLDQFFPRHPAAAYMIAGDLCALPGNDGFDAVCIADGMGNLFGWHEATGLRKIEVIKFAQADVKAAWRL